MSSPTCTRAPRDKHVSAGNRTQVAYVASEHFSKELFEQLMLLGYYFESLQYLNCIYLKYEKSILLQVGMKLEACDRQNKSLVCVASVANVLGVSSLLKVVGN